MVGGVFVLSVVLVSVSDESLWFRVSSSSRSGSHDVFWHFVNGWVCTCEHHYFRKARCKHIRACEDWLLEDKGFTVVGVSAYGVVVFDDLLVERVVSMGVYDDIKDC